MQQTISISAMSTVYMIPLESYKGIDAMPGQGPESLSLFHPQSVLRLLS